MTTTFDSKSNSKTAYDPRKNALRGWNSWNKQHKHWRELKKRGWNRLEQAGTKRIRTQAKKWVLTPLRRYNPCQSWRKCENHAATPRYAPLRRLCILISFEAYPRPVGISPRGPETHVAPASLPWNKTSARRRVLLDHCELVRGSYRRNRSQSHIYFVKERTTKPPEEPSVSEHNILKIVNMFIRFVFMLLRRKYGEVYGIIRAEWKARFSR